MRAVPGIQIPVLHDDEFEAVKNVLAEQGIEITRSEKSYQTDGAGQRLRAKLQ